MTVDPLTVSIKIDVQKRGLFPLSTQTSTSNSGRLQVLRESLSYAHNWQVVQRLILEHARIPTGQSGVLTSVGR